MDDLTSGFFTQRKMKPALPAIQKPVATLKENKIQKSGSVQNLLQAPVYDTNGDMYVSQKHKWRIYLQKRVKKKEEHSEDPHELLQSVDTYMKRSPLYSYNRMTTKKQNRPLAIRELSVKSSSLRTKSSSKRHF